MVEYLPYKQRVIGSSPITPTKRKNCAFARFQNKFEKHRFFACFFFSATKRNSHCVGELVATFLSLASRACIPNCAFARFQNKFEKHRLFACFFFSATKRNSHFSRAPEKCLSFFGKRSKQVSDKWFFYKTTKRNAVCDAVATFLEDCKTIFNKISKKWN